MQFFVTVGTQPLLKPDQPITIRFTWGEITVHFLTPTDPVLLSGRLPKGLTLLRIEQDSLLKLTTLYVDIEPIADGETLQRFDTVFGLFGRILDIRNAPEKQPGDLT